jgi:hypothetical protein
MKHQFLVLALMAVHLVGSLAHGKFIIPFDSLERLSTALELSTGDFLFAGTAKRSWMVYVGKFDKTGQKIWEKELSIDSICGPFANCYAKPVLAEANASGGFSLLTGLYKGPIGRTDHSLHKIEFDKEGEIKAHDVVGVPSLNSAALLTPDGGYFFWDHLALPFELRSSAIKFDKDKKAVWTNPIRAIKSTSGSTTTSDDGLLLVGGSKTAGSYLLAAAKLDSGGKVEWERSYPGIDQYGYTVTEGKNFYLIGGSGKNHVPLLWALDLSGNIKWTKTLPSNFCNAMAALFATDDGGFISIGNTGKGISSCKVDSNGNLVEQKWLFKTQDYRVDNQATDVFRTSDHGYLALGQRYDFKEKEWKECGFKFD